MSENYQNSITDQICKVQTSKKLIALYDRLRYTSYNSYAHEMSSYMQEQPQEQYLNGMYVA